MLSDRDRERNGGGAANTSRTPLYLFLGAALLIGLFYLRQPTGPTNATAGHASPSSQQQKTAFSTEAEVTGSGGGGAANALLLQVSKQLEQQRAEYKAHKKALDSLAAQVQGMSEQQKQTAEQLEQVTAQQTQAVADIKAAAESAAAAHAAAKAGGGGGDSGAVVRTGPAAKSRVNRNAGHWVVETSERVREKFGEMPPLPSSPQDRLCAGHSTCFFGRCFCEPGWTGDDCLTPLIPYNKWYTDCPNIDPKHKGTTPCPDNTIYYTHTNECHFLCGYHPDSGVARTDVKAWTKAQLAEAGVWSGAGPGNDRADEHYQGYGGFKALAGADFFFGDIVEFGCGPWTQTSMMLQHLNHPSSVGTVTLLEPNGARYLREVPGSSYRTGTLNGKYPVVLVSVGGEGFDDGWRFVEMFDTVVSMNVIEHVHDGFKYLMNLWLALKPGGTLIFHDRWFDDPIRAQGLLGSFALHPIRVNKVLMDHFVNQFEPLFKSTAKTDRMARARHNLSKGEDPGQTIMVDANEQAYYFIGRKPLNATTDFCKLKP